MFLQLNYKFPKNKLHFEIAYLSIMDGNVILGCF
jgi:hypothetical protein